MSETTTGLPGPLPLDESIRMTADIKITKRRDQPGSVVINGEDMSLQILAGSLSVTFPQPPEDYFGDAQVTLTLAANLELDVDGQVDLLAKRSTDDRYVSEAMYRDALAAVWDEGFSARVEEGRMQREDPEYPIHRTNPYAGARVTRGAR